MLKTAYSISGIGKNGQITCIFADFKTNQLVVAIH